MKTTTLHLLFLYCLSQISFSQEIKFGYLSPSDINLNECSYEKDAPAIIIFDHGNTGFIQDESGFILQFKRHVRIKILDESAFDKGEIEIPLYHSKDNLEIVRNIEAVTYNIEEGVLKKIPLDPKNIYKETINEYWYTKKFAMPQIKEGSIIEYRYTILSPFFVHFKDWEFQTDIPTLYSEYKVNMIPFYSYRYRLQGAAKIDHFKSYEKSGLERRFDGISFNDMVYEFALKNVTSFKDENYISSRNDYIKKIDFQMAEINYPSGYKMQYMESWPALAKELLDDISFGKYMKKAEKWGDKNLTHLKNKTESEQLNEIINYIKKTYKWNNYYGKKAQRTFKEFNTKLTGNIGNINLSTIGALRSVGLNASPVIISTRNNGKVTDSFPYSNLFNYVLILVEIDGKKRLVDASESLCPNHLIPSRCINGKGFIVEEDSEKWVNISNKASSMQEINLAYSINEDENIINGECRAKCTGYTALDERQNYYHDIEEFTEEITDKGLTISDAIKTTNLLEKELPFKYNFSFTQQIDKIDNQFIFSPFANLTEEDNPFKQETRSLPVDLVYLRSKRLIATIEIPEGYKVEELPLSKKIDSDNVAFNYIARINSNKIQVIASYQFKKQSYPAKNYRELKDFMNTVTKKINTKIILVKDNAITRL